MWYNLATCESFTHDKMESIVYDKIDALENGFFEKKIYFYGYIRGRFIDTPKCPVFLTDFLAADIGELEDFVWIDEG